MWRWLTIFIGCIFILQGCVSDNDGDPNKQEKEIKGAIDVNEKLFQAAENTETDTIRKLIEEGIDINSQDSQGRTATMIATYNNDVEIAKILIDAGADVNNPDHNNVTPIQYAREKGFKEIKHILLKTGAK
jgi:uncharacterized protein